MSQNCTTDFILSPKLDIITYNTELFATYAHKNGNFDHQKYLKIPKRPPPCTSIRERASNRNNTVLALVSLILVILFPFRSVKTPFESKPHLVML